MLLANAQLKALRFAASKSAMAWQALLSSMALYRPKTRGFHQAESNRIIECVNPEVVPLKHSAEERSRIYLEASVPGLDRGELWSVIFHRSQILKWIYY